MILAGEIGAEKTHLAIFEHNRDDFSSKFQKQMDSKSYSSLENLIGKFLEEAKIEESIYNACFGMAGFVDEANQTCQLSNSK